MARLRKPLANGQLAQMLPSTYGTTMATISSVHRRPLHEQLQMATTATMVLHPSLRPRAEGSAAVEVVVGSRRLAVAAAGVVGRKQPSRARTHDSMPGLDGSPLNLTYVVVSRNSRVHLQVYSVCLSL